MAKQTMNSSRKEICRVHPFLECIPHILDHTPMLEQLMLCLCHQRLHHRLSSTASHAQSDDTSSIRIGFPLPGRRSFTLNTVTRLLRPRVKSATRNRRFHESCHPLFPPRFGFMTPLATPQVSEQKGFPG